MKVIISTLDSFAQRGSSIGGLWRTVRKLIVSQSLSEIPAPVKLSQKTGSLCYYHRTAAATMADTQRRALHYVFKTGNRFQSWHFFEKILGMKTLRHEEFEEGCKATCNGPYDGKWSKTMLGYGNEDENFVVELTYNYGISAYRRGNDFRCIQISSQGGILERVKQEKYPFTQDASDTFTLVSPCGYTYVVNEGSDAENNKADKVPKLIEVSLACSNLSKTKEYYTQLLNMQLYEEGSDFIVVGYSPDQAKVRMVKLDEPIRREAAFGRTAFACPRLQLPEIERVNKEANQTILTPLVSLDTPGKATVEVVILADPDGHEICFVGDEAFRELSQIDPKASEQLLDAMAKDKSDDWFKKHGREKEER